MLNACFALNVIHKKTLKNLNVFSAFIVAKWKFFQRVEANAENHLS